MSLVLLLAAASLLAVYSISMKFIQGSLRFTLLVTSIYTGIIFIACFFLYLYKGYPMSNTTIIYGILWGAGCVVTQTSYFVAMQSGPLSYTTFIFSASMLIPALGSALLWNEKITFWQCCGILLFVLAFYLVGVPGAQKEKVTKKIWLPLCFLAFVCNGLLNIVVKAEQISVGGTYTLPMLVVSFGSTAAIAFLVFLILAWIRKEQLFPESVCKATWNARFAILCIAFSNGAANGLVTLLSSRVAGAWLYPCVLGGNMILVTIYSILISKEKINRFGKLGLITGLLAMFVMNI